MSEETTKVPGKLVFACGATMDVNDVGVSPVGSRLVVMLNPQPARASDRPIPCQEYMDHIKSTKPREELRMNCLIMCPVRVRDSKRKVTQGHDDTGWRGMWVTCQIKAHELDPAPAAAAAEPGKEPQP